MSRTLPAAYAVEETGTTVASRRTRRQGRKVTAHELDPRRRRRNPPVRRAHRAALRFRPRARMARPVMLGCPGAGPRRAPTQLPRAPGRDDGALARPGRDADGARARRGVEQLARAHGRPP